jgi:hypothetical protein
MENSWWDEAFKHRDSLVAEVERLTEELSQRQRLFQEKNEELTAWERILKNKPRPDSGADPVTETASGRLFDKTPIFKTAAPTNVTQTILRVALKHHRDGATHDDVWEALFERNPASNKRQMYGNIDRLVKDGRLRKVDGRVFPGPRFPDNGQG